MDLLPSLSRRIFPDDGGGRLVRKDNLLPRDMTSYSGRQQSFYVIWIVSTHQALWLWSAGLWHGVCLLYENGEWKSRTIRELEEMSKGENIIKWIKGQRINWLGHLERMEEDRIPKKIFTQELEGTRRRGRLRKGWKEEVERDLQMLWVRRWRELVADRKKWKDIVRQAKAHMGCSANGGGGGRRRRRRRRRCIYCGL